MTHFCLQSTTHPYKLHILASHTLSLVHSISLSTPPVFSLSLRLLAYASPNPNPHTHGPLLPTFISRAQDSLSASVMRVGGEVWSGVKAAVATSAAGLGGTDNDTIWGFSRSAPAASNFRDQFIHPRPDEPPPDDITRPDDITSGWVTVVDLEPLLLSTSPPSIQAVPRRVACFAPFPPEPSGIAHLTFSGVGGTPMLCVAPRDGQRVAVFQIRPGGAGRVGGTASTGADVGVAAATGTTLNAMEMPWHWYDLRRGLTSARVDNVVWEKAGLWAGVATGRRTIR